MIALLSGEVAVRRPDHVVVTCGGVGYRLAVSAETLRQVPAAGRPATLHTHLIVRDDALLLYGFATEAERDLFLLLIGVQGVADRDGERVRRMVGAGQVGQREQRLHHPLHLLLAGPARSAHRALDLLGRVGEAGDAALPGGQHDHPAGLPDGERGARVRAEVEVLDGERGRRVLVQERRHAGVDGGQPRAGIQPRRGLYHPAVERQQPTAAARHHAEARVRRAGIDAEGDHADGILRGGADAFRAAAARSEGSAARPAGPLDDRTRRGSIKRWVP